jgi:hypothetical protein
VSNRAAMAGRAFDSTVHSAFLNELKGRVRIPGAAVAAVAGDRERVDLAVEVDDSWQMLVIIEIKATDWDKTPAARVGRNLNRHLRPLQAYLHAAVEAVEAVDWGL